MVHNAGRSQRARWEHTDMQVDKDLFELVSKKKIDKSLIFFCCLATRLDQRMCRQPSAMSNASRIMRILDLITLVRLAGC